jgi:hypothetical protein
VVERQAGPPELAPASRTALVLASNSLHGIRPCHTVRAHWLEHHPPTDLPDVLHALASAETLRKPSGKLRTVTGPSNMRDSMKCSKHSAGNCQARQQPKHRSLQPRDFRKPKGFAVWKISVWRRLALEDLTMQNLDPRFEPFSADSLPRSMRGGW